MSILVSILQFYFDRKGLLLTVKCKKSSQLSQIKCKVYQIHAQAQTKGSKGNKKGEKRVD